MNELIVKIETKWSSTNIISGIQLGAGMQRKIMI